MKKILLTKYTLIALGGLLLILVGNGQQLGFIVSAQGTATAIEYQTVHTSAGIDAPGTCAYDTTRSGGTGPAERPEDFNSRSVPASRGEEAARFNAGAQESFVIGTNTYYRGTIFNCCYDQARENIANDLVDPYPEGCDNAHDDFSFNQSDPYTVTSSANVYMGLGLLRGVIQSEKTPEYGVNNFSYPSQYIFASRFNLPADAFCYTNPDGTNCLLAGVHPPDLRYTFKQNQQLEDYTTGTTRPPGTSGTQSWYEYLRRLVPLNDEEAIGGTVTGVTNFNSGNASTDLANNFPGARGDDEVFFVDGDLFVNTTSGGAQVNPTYTCDDKALIMVQGNLHISPQFRLGTRDLGSQEHGCLFIVGGETIIYDNNTSPEDIGLGEPYDLIEAGIMSSGEMEMQYSNGNPLKITGFAVGKSANIQRASSNNQAASLNVEYDPRYIELFKQYLKLLQFSIRERGYTPSP